MDKHKVMLAGQEMPDLSMINYPVYMQPKLDGYRATYLPGTGIISRTGKLFRNNDNLSNYFKSLEQVMGVVLDGELHTPQGKFQDLASTINKEGAEIKDLQFVIYDAVFLEDWTKQESKVTYEDRLRLVRTLVTSQIADHQKVLDIPTDLVHNFKEAKVLYKYYLDQGWEGAIIRKPESFYKWGRSTLRGQELLKVKPFKSADLKVIAVEEGQGQFEESMGRIACSLDNGNTVFVGSGFAISDREEIWNNKEAYIGKTAEIKYMDLTEDGSLRQPIFIRWRDDK